MEHENRDVKKTPIGRDEALELIKKAKKVWGTRGRKLFKYDLKKDKPGQDEIEKIILGRSGNLRSPSFLIGDTVLAGWNEDAFKELTSGVAGGKKT